MLELMGLPYTGSGVMHLRFQWINYAANFYGKVPVSGRAVGSVNPRRV